MGNIDQELHDKDHKALANMVADHSRIVILEQKVAEMKEDKKSIAMWAKSALVLVMGLGSWAFHLSSTIAAQDVYITKMEKAIEKNTKFVSEWPTGKLGGLPEDSVQSTKIDVLESEVANLRNKMKKCN